MLVLDGIFPASADKVSCGSNKKIKTKKNLAEILLLRLKLVVVICIRTPWIQYWTVATGLMQLPAGICRRCPEPFILLCKPALIA
jgi:hypothetical protein